MKKFVLILVSGLILTIFVLFNYFLWVRGEEVDRYKEQVQSLKEDQVINKNAREVDYDNFMSQLSQKNDMIESLTKQINTLKESTSKTEQEKQTQSESIEERNRVIQKLLLQSNLTPLEDVVKKWTEGIDNGKYEEAFKLQYPRLVTQEDAKKLNDFIADFKNTIQSFKLKSIKLYSGELPSSLKGSIILETQIEVKRVPETIKGDFSEGINKRYFKMSMYENNWIISEITEFL
jgi:Mg2+ and Co2+ transporter CorA